MGELGRINQLIISLPGYKATINMEVVVMSWIVFFILIVFRLFCRSQTVACASLHASAG